MRNGKWLIDNITFSKNINWQIDLPTKLTGERCTKRGDELKLLGILPRKKGRPRMYVGPEALEKTRQRDREAAAQDGLRKRSQLTGKDESTTIITSTTDCENSDQSSNTSGRSTQGPEQWSRLGVAKCSTFLNFI